MIKFSQDVSDNIKIKIYDSYKTEAPVINNSLFL